MAATCLRPASCFEAHLHCGIGSWTAASTGRGDVEGGDLSWAGEVGGAGELAWLVKREESTRSPGRWGGRSWRRPWRLCLTSAASNEDVRWADRCSRRRRHATQRRRSKLGLRSEPRTNILWLTEREMNSKKVYNSELKGNPKESREKCGLSCMCTCADGRWTLPLQVS
jgi:hypothetical protein